MESETTSHLLSSQGWDKMGVLGSSSSSKSSKSSGGSGRDRSSTSSSGESSSSDDDHHHDPSPAVPIEQVVKEETVDPKETEEEKNQLENKESDEDYYLDEDHIMNDDMNDTTTNNKTLSPEDHPLGSSDKNNNSEKGIENDSFLSPLVSHDSPKESIFKSQEEQEQEQGEDTPFQSGSVKENIFKSQEEQEQGEDTLFQSYPTESLINHATVDSSIQNEDLNPFELEEEQEGRNNLLVDDLQENDGLSDWSMNPEKEDENRPHFLFPYPLQDLPSEEWSLHREDASSDIYKPPREDHIDRQESQGSSSYHHEDSKEDKVRNDHHLDRSISDDPTSGQQEDESSEQEHQQVVLNHNNKDHAFVEGVDLNAIEEEIKPSNKRETTEINVDYVNQSLKGDDISQTEEQDDYYHQEEFDQGNTNELLVNGNENTDLTDDDNSNLYNNFEDKQAQAVLSTTNGTSSSRKGDKTPQLDSGGNIISPTESSLHSEDVSSRSNNDNVDDDNEQQSNKERERIDKEEDLSVEDNVRDIKEYLPFLADSKDLEAAQDENDEVNANEAYMETNLKEKEGSENSSLVDNGPIIDTIPERFFSGSPADEAKSRAVLEVNESTVPRETDAIISTISTTTGLTDIIPLNRHSPKSPADKIGQLSEKLTEDYVHSALMEVRALAKRPPELLVDGEQLPILTSHDKDSVDESDQLGEVKEFPNADIILSDGSTPVIHPLKLLDSDRYEQANERLSFFPSFNLKQPESSFKTDSDNQTPISQLGNMLRESPNEEQSNQTSSSSPGNFESIGRDADRMSETNTSSISSAYLTNTSHTFYDKFVEDAIQEGVSNISQLAINSPVVASDRTLLPFASMSQLDNLVSYKPNDDFTNHRLLPLNQQRLVKNQSGGLELSYPEKDPTGIPQDELLLMLRTLKPHASSNDVKSQLLTQIPEDEGAGESGYGINLGIEQDESASLTSSKIVENTAAGIVDSILARSTQHVITKVSASTVAVAVGKQESSIGTLSPPPEERLKEESEELAPEDFTISDDNTMHSEQGETTEDLKDEDIGDMLSDTARPAGIVIVKAGDVAANEGEVSEDRISPEESGGIEQSKSLTSTTQNDAETEGIEPLLEPTKDLSPTAEQESILAQASIAGNEVNSPEPRSDEDVKEGEMSSTSLVDPSTLMVGGNLDIYASQGLPGSPLKDDEEEGMDGEVLALLGDLEGEAMAEEQEQNTKDEDNDDDGLLMMQGTLPSISVKSPSSIQLGNSSSQAKATTDPSMVSSNDNEVLGEDSHFRFLDEVSASTTSSHSEDVKFSSILSNFDRVKSSMIITTTPSGEKKLSFVTPKSQATTPSKLFTPNVHENKLFEEEENVNAKNKEEEDEDDDDAHDILADVLNPVLDTDENVLEENDDNIDRYISSVPNDPNEENMESDLIDPSMVEGNEEAHDGDDKDAVLTPSVLHAGSTANTIATSRARTPPAGGSVSHKSLLTATSIPNRKQTTVSSSNFPAADWKCLEAFSHSPDEPHRLVESVQLSLKKGLIKSYTTIQDDLRRSYREAGSALLSHLEEIEKVFYAIIQKVSFEKKPSLPQILASPEIDQSIYVGESEKEELVKSLISLENNLAEQVEQFEMESRKIYDSVKQELSRWNVLDMPGRLEALFEGTATNELSRRKLSYFHISDVTDYLRSPLNTIMRWTSPYVSNHLTEDSQIALLKSSRNVNLSLVQANDRIGRRYYALYQAKIGVLESEELIEKAQIVFENHINGQLGRATDILEALCYPPYEEDPPEDAKVYRRLVLDKIRPNRHPPPLPVDGSLFGADSKVSSSLSDDSTTAQDKFSSHKKSRKDKSINDSKQRPATAFVDYKNNGPFAEDIAHPKVQRPQTAEGKADRSNGNYQAKRSSPAPGSPYRGTPYYLPDAPDDGTIWVHVKESEKHHHPPYLPHEAGRQSKALRQLMKSPERIAYDISWSDKLCQGLDYQDNYDAIHALNKLGEARKQKLKQSKSILSAVEMHTALKKGLTKSSLFSRDLRSILKSENGLECDPLLYNMIHLSGVKPSKFALTKKMIRCYSFSPSKAMTFAEKAVKTKEDLRNFQARSKERLRGELKGRSTPTKKMKATESESSFFNEEEVIMGSHYKRKPLISEDKIKVSEPFVARMRGEAMRARSPSTKPSAANLPPLLEHLRMAKESDGESSSSPPRPIAKELSFKEKEAKESQDTTSFSGPILWQGDVERDQSQPGDLLVGLASAQELLNEKEGMTAQSQQQQSERYESTINMEGESMENKESNENALDASSLIADEQAAAISTAFDEMAVNKDARQPSAEKNHTEVLEKDTNDPFTSLDESQTRAHLIKLFTEECGLVIDESRDILNIAPLEESLSTIFKSWEAGSSSSAAVHSFSSSSRRPSVSGGGAVLRKMTQLMRITQSISNSKITKMMERLAISPAILETEAQIEVLLLLIEKSLESSRLRDAGQLAALQLPEIPAAYDLATSTYNVRRPGYNPLANEHVHGSPLRVPSGPLIKLDVTDYLSDKHLLKDLEKELNEGHSSPKPFRTGYMDAKQRQARLLPPADDRPGQSNKSLLSSNRNPLDQKLDSLLFSIKKWRKHLHNALFGLYEIHVAELFCPIVFMIQQEVRYRSGRAMLRAKRSPALTAQSIEPIADQIRSLLDNEVFASVEPLLSFTEEDYFTKRSLAVARVFDQASQLADELAEENVTYARHLASLSHA